MQSIIITAYKDPLQLRKLVLKLNQNFAIYIHIDKRSKEFTAKFLDELSILQNVKVISKYKISWGSINHLYAVLECMNMVIADGNIGYVHVISGQDYPIRAYAEFEKKFTDESKEIYMSMQGQELFNDSIRERCEQYFMFPYFDYKKEWTKRLNGFTNRLQRKLGIHRKHWGDYKKLYKGMIWVSLQ